MFHVEYDRRTNCLNICVEGFWKPEDVPAFAQVMDSEARLAKRARPDFNACVESLKFPVQAIDVADLLSAIMRSGIGMTTGRAAVVVGSQLNKAQAERTLVHPRVRIFVAVDEARAWLAAPASGCEAPVARAH